MQITIGTRLELSILRFGVIEQNGYLPRAHHPAVFGAHPIEFFRHRSHGQSVNADFRAIKQQLIIIIFRRMEDHEANPELLPLFIELHILHSHTSVSVSFHLVEQLGGICEIMDITGIWHDLKICYSINTTLPSDNVVVSLLNYSVFVVEEVLRGDQRLLGDPDITNCPFEVVLEWALFLPFVEFWD